ncbi:MAG: DUF4062 domain-containing protein [Treponema sp.]|nr:DUF4062 domain-containing protein [Treponema sp.]
MKKRYQVFLSSTYDDLKEERDHVMRVLMKVNCIPAGMELFPAVDEEQLEFIKKRIDESDYYLLIIGGRYGSTSSDGISYTEKEYDYAKDKGLDIICLIHKNPDAIPFGKSEENAEMRKKLDSFREKAKKGRVVEFWENHEELQLKAVSSLFYAIENHPAIGYVRADLVPDEDSSSEILKQRNRISELERQIESVSNKAPAGSENLAHGDDLFEINYSYEIKYWKDINDKSYADAKLSSDAVAVLSWNKIFSYISPVLLNEANEGTMKIQINRLIYETNYVSLFQKKEKNEDNYSKKELSGFKVIDTDFQTIKIQLRSLGLITQSKKTRSVKDAGAYWTLTPYGDNVMTYVMAIKKK